jgi:hypothetical protein
MEFWFQITLEGYIIKFSMENQQSFSKEEAIFLEGS